MEFMAVKIGGGQSNACDWDSWFKCRCGHRYHEVMRDAHEVDDCPMCGDEVLPYFCVALPADHEAEALECESY